MEKTRSSLIDAYVRLGCAQADSLLHHNKADSPAECIYTSPTSTSSPSVALTDLELTISEVQKFVELSDVKVFVKLFLMNDNYIYLPYKMCGSVSAVAY